jgi:hypothetical protein
MMGLIKAQAAAGDPSAIRDLKFLRSIGVIEEPKAEKELMIWELFDMAKEAKEQEKRDYWKRKRQMQQQ